jgi:hypothetical protein
MGMFDFFTNPINDAWDAAVNSNPITSGISDAVHTIGEKTGVNDVVDTVAPYVAAAAAIYLTGGALAPEAMAALEGGAAEAGLTAEEYAALVADSAPVDSAMAGAEAPSFLSQVGSAYSALPSAVQTGLSTLGKTALGKVAGSLLGGTQSNKPASYGSSLYQTPMSSVTGVNQQSSPTGLSSLDFTPHVTKGQQIQLVGDPTFTNTVTPTTPGYITQQQQPMQYAADGGIMGYAEGSSPQVTRGHPQFLQSYTNNIGHPKMGLTPFGHKEGGEIEGHNPQFYSEGGLNSMQNRYVTGDGDGTSDSIPAMLANGEFVIPADVVSGLGNGSNEAGAEVLDEFMKVIRQHKRDADPEDLPPESKGPLTYLDEAQKNIKVK